MFTIVPFLVAFCSMIYELVLAQYISLYFGGTVFNFTLTIGLFLASMGVGSFLSARIGRLNTLIQLENIEIGLSTMGFLSPILVSYFGSQSLAHADFRGVFFILSYSLVIIIGVLSGYEIPLLMNLAEDRKNKRRVLGFDYMGSFIAALAYPFIFLPSLGLIQTALIAAFINVLISLYLGGKIKKINAQRIIEGGLLFTITVLLVKSLWLESILRDWLYS